MTTIDYFMTLNSPWTYLGAARFGEIVARHNATVRIKPSRFAEVFARTGGLPLAKRSPERRAYRMMELKRWRDHLGVPINLEPKHFPSDETIGTRLVIAAALQGKDACRLALELGRSLWELEGNLGDEAVVAAAAERAGLDAAAIRRAGPSDEALDRLHDQNTAEALERGVFGAPSYVLPSGEIFWGQDRLEFLERALAKG
ncbi:MAG: 2-hydroxychromene-2-carboxylate isomerase [Hyphomicrobiaceae bacterium]